MVSDEALPLARFGPGGRFELQPRQRRLLADGQPVTLGARAFDLLVELARRPDELCSKHELIEAVWPGVVVEEGNLATQISTLRKVLGGDVIATIPGHGYRFIAPRLDPPTAEAIGDPGPAQAQAQPAASETLRTNLPADLPPLIGRADDLAALEALAAQHRLVSIVGAGGMGKTALAQTFLHGSRAAYPHGVCWVDLAPVTGPQALPAAVAAALGLTLGGGEPLPALCGAVAPLTLLMVLDNAEQLLDDVARLAQALLDAAPGLRLIVTSQAPLRLASECLHRLGALDVPQTALPADQARSFGAVALFEVRAMQADSRWRLCDDNVQPVIEACRALDGLALAIELAAARAPMLGMNVLAASMDQRLRLLTASRNRAAPARQQTLRAALEWSHGFLDDREQAVFRRLGLFAGSGSLASIQQVAGDPASAGELDEWAVLDALALLVDRSLVTTLDTGTGEPRYRLLETPRLFALEKLRAAGEEDACRRRHALAMSGYFGALWDERWSGTIGRKEWLERVAADLDNAWQAYAWACDHDDRTTALRIAAVLMLAAPVHPNRRALVELCDRCEPWLHDLPDVDLHAHVAGGIATILEDFSLARGEAVMCTAQERVAAAVPTPWRYWLLHWLGARRSHRLARLGRFDEARALLAEADGRDDPAWPPCRRVAAPLAAHTLAAEAGDRAEALLQLERLKLRLEAAGASTWLVTVNFMDLQLASDDAAGAVATGRALVASLAGGRHAKALAVARAHLAAAHIALGETEAARADLEAAWPESRRLGQCVFIADYLALLAALEARPRAAARLAGFGDAVNAAVGPRQPNEAVASARTAALARAALGDAEFERLRAEGQALREADIAPIAFAAGDIP